MKLGIMQPYFFPYIGYWQLVNAVDTYVIHDDVNYIKGGWINRNNILLNGQAKLINLQIYKASQNKLINEIELLGDKIFNNKLLKTIENWYKKAPYFDTAFPIIKDIIKQDEKNLAKYLTNSILILSDYLGINTKFIISSDMEKDNSLKGQERVIEICKKLNATEYINAIGGMELYSKDDFEAEGIKLKFLKTKEVRYKQFDNDFISNLSIIDVMMFNEPCKINKMLNDFEML